MKSLLARFQLCEFIIIFLFFMLICPALRQSVLHLGWFQFSLLYFPIEKKSASDITRYISTVDGIMISRIHILEYNCRK